jgi:hypothetical protein
MTLQRIENDLLLEGIRSSLRISAEDWPVAPLIATVDLWQVTPLDQAAKLIAKLAAHLAEQGIWLNCEPITRLRTLPLLCYRDGILCEGETRVFDGRPALVTFIVSGDAVCLLDGRSPPIHALNIKEGTIDLSEPENASQYLSLFCAVVQADEGPFRDRLDQRD